MQFKFQWLARYRGTSGESLPRPCSSRRGSPAHADMSTTGAALLACSSKETTKNGAQKIPEHLGDSKWNAMILKQLKQHGQGQKKNTHRVSHVSQGNQSNKLICQSSFQMHRSSLKDPDCIRESKYPF